MAHQWILLLSGILAIVSAEADTQVQLAPIVKEGTPGDLLLEDSVVPGFEGRTLLNTGSGSVQNSIQNQVAIPVTTFGGAGGAAFVRGLGPAAEDVDVQAFGISLNPPQGGGFDLSSFPQFLWSNFRYQPGPTLNSLNPTSTTGTLSLIPWTSQAISESARADESGEEQRNQEGRVVEFYSDAGLNQISVAGQAGKNIAVVAGYSSDQVEGPSGGMSARWSKKGYVGSFHLLASDVRTRVPGPSYQRSPRAQMDSLRMIPVLQNDFKMDEGKVLKTSLFYDRNDLNFEDPDTNTLAKNKIRQWGFQTVYLHDRWKVGLNGRQVEYFNQSDWSFSAPMQTLGNLQASRDWNLGPVLVEPVVQGVWVTGLGLLPQGSVGARYDWDQGRKAVYLRSLISQRVPSLLDRYALAQDFVGNPNLRTELAWTEILGTDVKSEDWETSLQAYGQLRQNARVYSGGSVTNLQSAYITAVTLTNKAIVNSQFDLFNSITGANSRVLATGRDFLYIPKIFNVFGVSIHSKSIKKPWDWTTSFRSSSSQFYQLSSEDELPGYGVFDTGVRATLFEHLSLSGRVENLFDKKYELVKGYSLGRIFSVMLVGFL